MKRLLVLTAALCLVAPLTATAAVAPGPGVDVGACAAPAADAGYAVLPVQAGVGFSANTCLATQVAQAAALPGTAQFYVNGAMPGPTSTHWPQGDCTGVASTACAQGYGDALARDALATVDAAVPAAVPTVWWVDVESVNTWLGPAALDVASIRGTVQALQSRPDRVAAVGLYSSHQQWQDITGGDTSLTLPQWSASPSASEVTARSNCLDTAAAFTSGPVVMTQYARAAGGDGDVVCPPRLTAKATGTSGHAITLKASAFPGSAVSVQVTQVDHTVTTRVATADARGVLSTSVPVRYDATVTLTGPTGATAAGLTVAPTLSAPKVHRRGCVLDLSGTVSPAWSGQSVAVKVAGGRGRTVGTRRSGSGATWKTSITEPCGRRLTVTASTTGHGGGHTWVSAATSRATTVSSH